MEAEIAAIPSIERWPLAKALSKTNAWLQRESMNGVKPVSSPFK
jgi:hypothetical protein